MGRVELLGMAMAGFVLAELPVLAQGRSAASPLDRLEPGRWELRGAGGADLGSICLGDARALGQVQHRGAACSRELVDVGDRTVTVRYSCPGLGSGRTVLRVETPRLAQFDSQGLDSGTPFALRGQARRVGACAVTAGPSPTRR